MKRQKMKIIPAIDIIDGKCVRLSKGDYDTKKVYNKNPIEVAIQFESYGIEYLHIVDLDGAKVNKIVNHRILEDICTQTNLKVDFGGGVKSREQLEVAFDCGANQVVCGSIAVKQPELFASWIAEYGSDRLVLGADCQDRMIATDGWLESSELDVIDFIKDYSEKGITDVACTDISKDGMLSGPSIDLYREIMSKTDINLIASGGVANLDDVLRLRDIGCYGVIIGKAIYEGNITLQELSKLV